MILMCLAVRQIDKILCMDDVKNLKVSVIVLSIQAVARVYLRFIFAVNWEGLRCLKIFFLLDFKIILLLNLVTIILLTRLLWCRYVSLFRVIVKRTK